MSVHLPGYRLLRLDRTFSGGGGVAIAVKNNTRCRLLPCLNLKLIEAIAVEVTTSVGPVVVIAVYYPRQVSQRDGSAASFKQDIIRLTRRQPKYIIGGDINTRHQSWGDQRRNKNGTILSSELQSGHFTILSPDSPTRLSRTGAHAFIDLFLTNMGGNIDDPVVHNDLSSDHFPVVVEVGAEVSTSQQRSRRNYHRANWPEFQRRVDVSIDFDHQIHSAEDIDTALDTIDAAIQRARQDCIPEVPQQVSDLIQIDSTTLHLIRLRNLYRRQFQRTGIRERKRQANQLSRVIQARIVELRNSKFSQTIQNLPNHSKPFWKVAKVLKTKPKPIPPLIPTNPSTNCVRLITPPEKANELGQHFVSSHNLGQTITSPQQSLVDDTVARIETTPLILQEDETITADEVIAAIRSSRNMKAPGFDNTFNIELKHLSANFYHHLASIFNKCLTLGYFPSRWKLAKVIPILKPGKDPSCSRSYRPISLLPAISKLFEKVILTRLLSFADENNIFLEEQFGFRRGHSTVHQLRRVTNIIRRNKSVSKSTAMALLDVEKAFDNVWHNGLVFKLLRYDFPLYLTKIIQNYLSGRAFQVSLNGITSSSFGIPAGVPQGSILGPILFNIFTSDIPALPCDGKLSLFADDTGILFKGRSVRELTSKLQRGLDVLNNYFHQWKICINAAKTQVIIFPHRNTPRLVPPENMKVHLNGNNIDWSTEVVYLGLTLDSKLLFRAHVDKTTTRCNILIRSLYPLINRSSRLTLKNKLAVYKQIIYPVIAYAVPIWECCAQTHRLKLQRIQNKILRMILNSPPRTRNSEIHELAGIKTLDEKFNIQCSRFGESCSLSGHQIIQSLYA